MAEGQSTTIDSATSQSGVKSADDTGKQGNPTVTSSSTNRIFAPLNIPLHRRFETLTILVWWLMPWSCLLLTVVLLCSNSWYVSGGVVLYITWMIAFRKYPKRGGHRQQWLRRLFWWRWYADYFPIHLHKTCDLPPDRPYVFGCHPHGIISLGSFGNFATEGTGFEKLFPGINLRFLVLNSNFYIPFYELFLTMMNICDSSRESCNYILQKGQGNSILLVLGGSKEALDARPSSEYYLTLKNRKGFVKIALTNGASLVPVFSFGENDLYEQVPNPRGSLLRTVQTVLQQKIGYSLPLFHGRGVFQYKFGLLPNRHPIDTYIGAPIEVPKLSLEQITPQIVDEYHTKYMDALTRLFDTYKAKHDNANASIVFVDDANK